MLSVWSELGRRNAFELTAACARHSFRRQPRVRAIRWFLPESVDPCGEHGEFHRFVFDGPMFDTAIDVKVGETIERDGFVFTDVIPVLRHANGMRI